MPSFSFLDNVELYIRSGKFPVNASKNLRKVIRTASKNFNYKDGCLWRSYRGRLLRVVRSDEDAQEILTRYHDNNNHAGRVRAVKEIMLMHYWVGVTESVKNWIRACSVCQSRLLPPNHEAPVQFCLVYGCNNSSYANPELSFYRFPKVTELRQKWLAVAQRDEGSLRTDSNICSQHFDLSCFTRNAEGQQVLSSDAIPTIIPATVQGNEVPVSSHETFFYSSTLEDVLSTAARAADPCNRDFDHSKSVVGMQEHQYCLQAPAPDLRAAKIVREDQKRAVVESCFLTYNHIARYLSSRVLPMQGKKRRAALRRMAKRFDLIDGVLMYTRVSPPLRVPRSREEVNSILQQFHDNQGHYGQGICQRAITKHFYWATLTRDLSGWISSCHTCFNRTKRKWLRCSVYKCSNCCGPVERGLGLTFHKFPHHNGALLTKWVNAVGRANWHPRLWSSICSIHFTNDCFDHSGEKVTLHMDAVPTLGVHSNLVTQSRGLTHSPVGDQAFFAKYDAVELYLSRRTYPPGLSYVEKNTFRRFCRKFIVKDGMLHMMKEDQLRLVLRNKQQVEAALMEYHNELNHLDVRKCLRLLNERCFWKSMRPDVVQWINNCSQCNVNKIKRPYHRAHHHSDSSEEDLDTDGGSKSGMEEQQTMDSAHTVMTSEINLQLQSPVCLQVRNPIGFQPRTPSADFAGRVRSAGTATPAWSEVSNSSESQRGFQTEDTPPPKESMQPENQKKTSSSERSGGTCDYIPGQGGTQSLTKPHPPPETQTSARHPNQHTDRHSLKRKRKVDADPSAKGNSSCGLDPVVAPSTKPWPVFTIANSAKAAQPLPEVDSSRPVFQKSKRLQARTMIQQCIQAKVKVRPALDGVDAQWVEIQEGMVVYVCFFHGATEEVTREMANSLMSTKIFRKDTGHSVSLLDLPGSVLFIPQDSLLGEPLPNRRMQYKGGCELWWGAQLFSSLVSACRELVFSSVKCAKAGVKVEQGVYGQKQEILLSSLEPFSMLLEF